MRILVTGGAGFLGSTLVPMIFNKTLWFSFPYKGSVTVLDNFMQRVPSLYDCCHYDNFNIIRGDVRDRDLLMKEIPKYDVIIWLAAIVGVPAAKQDPYKTVETNQTAVNFLSEILSKDQRVIYPCTNSGYGTKEGRDLCDETCELKPDSLYGTTKVEAERVLLSRENTVSLRLATLFGMSPRMRVDLLTNDFVYRALKDGCLTVYQGSFKRNAIHVRDAARAFIHVLDHWETMKGNAYNVGNETCNLTKVEICNRIRNHLPKFYFSEAPYREDPDKRNFALDCSKLNNTGYRPVFSLDDGIRELIKGYAMLENRRLCNVV